MAQRSSRKRRKDRQRAARGDEPQHEAADDSEDAPEEDPVKAIYARSRAKSDAVRESLVPLQAGERTPAVTVAAVVTGLLGLGNLISYFVGVEVQGEKPPFSGIAIYSVVMFVAAWGCWKMRYWAVLGVQVLLGFGILIFSLLLVKAESALAVLIAVVVIAACGALFWFLIKSMARIQMPERPGANR